MVRKTETRINCTSYRKPFVSLLKGSGFSVQWAIRKPVGLSIEVLSPTTWKSDDSSAVKATHFGDH